MSDLSPLEIDTIAEVGNISLGASATALSAIINKRVEITTPRLNISTVLEVKNHFPLPCIVAEVNYSSGLQGSNILLIKEKDARVIASLMIGSPVTEADKPMDEIEISALQEAMNQMMGQMATSMSELFNRRIEITPPSVELRNLTIAAPVLRGLADQDKVVEIVFKMSVEELIDSTLVQLVPLKSARAMALFLLGEEAVLMQQASDMNPATLDLPLRPEEGVSSAPDSGALVPAAPDVPLVKVKETLPGGLYLPPRVPTENSRDQTAVLEKLELVKDLSVDVTAILSGARLPLGKLFDMENGCIIDLDGYINEPVELLVNGKLIASGEVVLIDEQLGVRITKMHLEQSLGSAGSPERNWKAS
ncbi:MAG: flagellar motor switch phosphatase FliY [Dethiobacter sp.]|jgi:flagellar motor switch protein FliN/FliY|nr:flagellar motor switch phosphatase FliY [Dethiobacter sp.]